MEELVQLRRFIETGHYAEALALLDELEEMSRDDKINRISSFMEVLLVHLIKRSAEKRTTRSWEVSIRNSARQINRLNKRRKAGGVYLSDDDLASALQEAYSSALDSASLEAFDGKLTAEALGNRIDTSKVFQDAMGIIKQQRHEA